MSLPCNMKIYTKFNLETWPDLNFIINFLLAISENFENWLWQLECKISKFAINKIEVFKF